MIFLIFSLVCAFGLSISGSLTFWPVQHWYDFYIPIVLFIGGWVGSMSILWIFEDLAGRFTTKVDKVYDKPSKFNRWCMNNAMAYIRRLALITVKLKHKEKLPVNKRVLVVCNHRSNFDNFLITEKLFMNDDIAFICKEDNFHIPLAKRHMIRLGYLKIDRNDFMQSLQVMKTATERIEKNYTSIAVFPEGTRSKDGGSFGTFHEGVFNIAIKAKCPIVILTIKGTEKIAHNWPKVSKTEIDVVGVLEPEYFEGKTAKAISDEVRGIIQENISY